MAIHANNHNSYWQLHKKSRLQSFCALTNVADELKIVKNVIYGSNSDLL